MAQAARGDKLVYYSIKYEQKYHTCNNCSGGRQIRSEYRRVITEKEAASKSKFKKCKSCLTIEAAGEPCDKVTF